MNNIITVKIKDVFGTEKAYPANDQAERLAALVGTKTLTGATLRSAKAMGFRITWKRGLGEIVDFLDSDLRALA